MWDNIHLCIFFHMIDLIKQRLTGATGMLAERKTPLDAALLSGEKF
jgi:hypothetical protein